MVAKRKKHNKKNRLCKKCDHMFVVKKVGKKNEEITLCPKCMRSEYYGTY